MKKIFFLALTLVFALLISENPDWNLGEFVIEGKSSPLPDSIRTSGDLKNFWKIDPKKIECSPRFINFDHPKPVSSISGQNIFSLWLQGGNNEYLDLNAVFSSEKSPLLDFRTSIHNQNLKTGWLTRNFNLDWLPQIKSKLHDQFDFSAGLEYNEFDSDFGYTEFYGLNLSSLFTHRFLFSRKVDLLFDGAIYELQQDTVKSRRDYDLRFDLLYEDKNLLGAISSNNLIGSISGKFLFGKKQFLFFDELAVWTAFDEMHLYPSIHLRKMIEPLAGLRIFISNEPLISELSRRDNLHQNPYQAISLNKYQSKIPLNLDFTTEFNSIIPLSLSYNLSWVKDQRRYIYTAGQFYEQEMIDLIRQKFSLLTFFEYRAFQFWQELFYNLRSEALPFEPNWNYRTALEFRSNIWKIRLAGNHLFGRKDTENRKMGNVFLLDASADLTLKKNIHLTAEIENILVEKYIRMTDLPQKPLLFYLGLRMAF